jgi:tRNA A37 threonylcarbamoyladenosine synthetase subunit TsaC/SUA5/YrdC
MEEVDASIVKSVDCTFDIPARLVRLPSTVVRLPSTVVRLEGGKLEIMREGAIPSSDIYDAVAEEV